MAEKKWKRSAVIQADADIKIAQLQAQAQKEAAQLQYDASMQQIEAQKDANAQQQKYNKEEAELAFRRNSSKGQLQQLMDAGLSEQQARQIIAGGSAGSYTAAPSVNQNQGVDYTAPASALGNQKIADANAAATEVQANANAEINHAKTQILDWFNDSPTKLLNTGYSISESLINDSLFSENGGYVGNLATGSLQGQVLRHINEIPEESRASFAGFCEFANSAAAPAWCKTADMQNAISSAYSSPMARRAANSFFNTSNQFLTGQALTRSLLSDSQMKSSAAKIASFKVDEESLAFDLAKIENDYKIAILPERYGAMLTSFQSDIAEMATKRDLWENDEYKRAWLASHLTNEEDAAVLATVMKAKHDGQFKYIKDNPDMKQLFAIYQMFDDVGMTDTLFGEVVASIEAYGKSTLNYGVSDILKGIKDWIVPGSSDSKKAKEAKDKFWIDYLNYNHQPHM